MPNKNPQHFEQENPDADSKTELDDETIFAIIEAEAQADRGEGVDLDTFHRNWKNKSLGLNER